MKIAYERLVNLGNYNNERVSLEDDVRPGESPEEAYARLRALAHRLLMIRDPHAKHAEAGEEIPF